MQLEVAKSALIASALPGFNSILVQLEADNKGLRPAAFKCFNSILVQLEAAYIARYCTKKITFQFHIGAIRRRNYKMENTTLASFNSILVQLEGAGWEVTEPKFDRFNSILVQLEDFARRCSIRNLAMFQFHIGAIRSRLDFGWKVPVLLKSKS